MYPFVSRALPPQDGREEEGRQRILPVRRLVALPQQRTQKADQGMLLFPLMCSMMDTGGSRQREAQRK
jgi:hypothetical protein